MPPPAAAVAATTRLTFKRHAGDPDRGAVLIGPDSLVYLRELAATPHGRTVAVFDVVEGEYHRRLELRPGERMSLGCGASVEFCRRCDSGRAKILVEAPRDVRVDRGELAGRVTARDVIEAARVRTGKRTLTRGVA